MYFLVFKNIFQIICLRFDISCVCVGFSSFSASCFLLSVCPSVRLSVRSSGLSFTKVVNTLCWKRMNRFWYTLVQVGKGIKRSTLGVRRSKSRSNKAEDLEAWRRHHSRPWFLVYLLYCVVFTIPLCTYYAFLFFLYYLLLLLLLL